VSTLTQIDQRLGSWRVDAAAGGGIVDLADAQVGARLFGQGTNRREADNSVISELGFWLSVANPTAPGLSLGVTAGVDAKVAGLVNSFVLRFPAPAGADTSLYAPALAEAVLDAVVQEWEPWDAAWTSYQLTEAQGDASRKPVVGWLTYTSKPARLELPGVTTRHLPPGSVVKIGDDFKAVTGADVVRVRDALDQAGALEPVP
jgi:hypothetical protein